MSERKIQGPLKTLFRAWRFIFYLLGVILLWVFFLGLPLRAQVSASADRPGAEGKPGAGARGGSEKAWFAHREFLEKGDWEKSQGELEKVYQWKLDQGIRNHYSYSFALIRESKQTNQRGNSAVPELLNYAEKMAPDFSQVRKARAGWQWSQTSTSWEKATEAVLTWFQGVWDSFTNLEEALPQMANLSLWILLSFLLTFVVFALSLFVRYFSFFGHHLKHLIRIETRSLPLLVLGPLFLFSPFFLGLGWMWVMVLWVLIFWAYQGRTDRIVTVTLLSLLLLLPTGIRFYSSLLLSISGNGVPEILRANTGAWNRDVYQKMLAMNQESPQDPDVLQALGLVEKRMGKFTEAEQRFLQIAHLDPQSGSALNNLGNIYLVTNRLDQAIKAYQKATRLEPLRGEAYYNLGQAYLLKLRIKEAEAEFQKAKILQPQFISYHTSISSRHPNRLVIDRTIDPFQVWRRILASTPERDEIARALWSFFWGGVPLEYGEMAMITLFVILGVAHLLSQRLSFIRNCERCGRLICSRCSRPGVIGAQCVQCLNAFTANPSADPQGAKKKRDEVARYQAWLTSFPQRISLILPGLGHLIRGNSGEGIFCQFIFILFLTQVFLQVGRLPNPMVLGPTLSLPWIVVLTVLFLLFYSLVQYRMRQIRAQGGRSHFRKP